MLFFSYKFGKLLKLGILGIFEIVKKSLEIKNWRPDIGNKNSDKFVSQAFFLVSQFFSFIIQKTSLIHVTTKR